MTPSGPSIPGSTETSPSITSQIAEKRLVALSSMLNELDEAPVAAHPSESAAGEHQNRLTQVRLGIGSSLFIALRAKHGPTALHSLRVALGCSSWAGAVKIENSVRDNLEVAALLHDIGKIGVPDHVLLKPGRLDAEEAAIMARHRQFALEILGGCSPSREMLDIIYYSPAWYDGTHGDFDRKGKGIPLGARMLSIVDAFDSMTTAHVYRAALPIERAMAELFKCAGTQFDPKLVQSFHDLHHTDQSKLHAAVARRWLQQLNPEMANSHWHSSTSPLPPSATHTSHSNRESLFHEKLLENMHDGVAFIDKGMQIQQWNRGAERLTGLSAESILTKHWSPKLIDLRSDRGILTPESDCPVHYTIQTGVQTHRRMQLENRQGESVTIDCHVIPVVGQSGALQGATLLLHDASSETHLEERVQNLHERASKDPLTQISNRAEFDSALERFVKTHLERSVPCSLIICDIDHFKNVNDRYGHQAGDEALIGFAKLLDRLCRVGDMVARYGGEEFVMLCSDCDNVTASQRAEELRRELADIPQPMLGGKKITASFGVTELQPGDTPETMLRRADRGLLQAKDRGRNVVVQMGAGMDGSEEEKPEGWWKRWLHKSKSDILLERRLVTSVPLNIVAEKLRGFVSDHHAEIASIEEDHIILKIDHQSIPLVRRRGDRTIGLVIELLFSEEQLEEIGNSPVSTVAKVTIRPKRNRDRRRRDATERAKQLLSSLKSYLVAHDENSA